MMLIPVQYKDKVKLLVVLEDDNLERIKVHDCAEVIWSQLGQYASARPESVTIGYASPEEAKLIHEFAERGEIAKTLELVTGGFRYRPELGDHDSGPVSILKRGRKRDV